MRLPPYPPSDFKCVYQHSCPYLDWLSTTWVSAEYRRAMVAFLVREAMYRLTEDTNCKGGTG